MGQEAGKIQLVEKRAGVGHVMGGLQVGAEYKLATLAQSFLHMETKGLHEVVLVIQNRQVILANRLLFPPQSRRGKHASNGHFVEIRLDEATLAISLLVSKAVHDGFWEMTGIDTNAPIFVTLAINKIGFVALRDQVKILDLVGPHAVVLNANHVSVLAGQPLKEAFFNSLGQTVDADCYYPHTCSLIRFVCMIPVLRVN